jgi:RHS repeat-associated protein
MVRDNNKGIKTITYNHLNLPVRIEWSAKDFITYKYNAAGQKVQKRVVANDSVKVVDYLDGFQYAGGVLQFFPHAEGYVKATPAEAMPGSPPLSYIYNYVFNYTDHLGNVRLSYSKDPQTGVLEILDENHYYPFGLKHEVYVSANKKEFDLLIGGGIDGGIGEVALKEVLETKYLYKFQGQELQDELGLNWYSFKWRNYMPDIGRFFNIDPLAEDYSYQSPYNFSENRVIDGIELEGLEWKSIKNEETGNTNVQLTVQLYNASSLNEKQLNKRIEAMKTQFSESFSGDGYTGELIVNVVTKAEGDFLVKVVDGKSRSKTDEYGNTKTKMANGAAPNSLENVNTQASEDKSTVRISIAGTIDGSRRSKSGIARTFAHEAGHTAGLRHTHDPANSISDVNQDTPGVKNKTLRKNLMNSDVPESRVPSGTGTHLENSQLKYIDETIKSQQ